MLEALTNYQAAFAMAPAAICTNVEMSYPFRATVHTSDSAINTRENKLPVSNLDNQFRQLTCNNATCSGKRKLHFVSRFERVALVELTST